VDEFIAMGTNMPTYEIGHGSVSATGPRLFAPQCNWLPPPEVPM